MFRTYRSIFNDRIVLRWPCVVDGTLTFQNSRQTPLKLYNQHLQIVVNAWTVRSCFLQLEVGEVDDHGVTGLVHDKAVQTRQISRVAVRVVWWLQTARVDWVDVFLTHYQTEAHVCLSKNSKCECSILPLKKVTARIIFNFLRLSHYANLNSQSVFKYTPPITCTTLCELVRTLAK